MLDVDRRMNGREMDGVNKWINEWNKFGWMDRRMDRWMEEQMDGKWISGWMDKWMEELKDCIGRRMDYIGWMKE